MNDQQHFPPIADYGLIGNCHTAALVARDGSLDWLCLPRFDSPSLFARILDLERGGSWSIQPITAFSASQRYLEHTNVLETTFTTDNGSVTLHDCMDVSGGDPRAVDIVPGPVVRVIQAIDGTVEMIARCAPRPDYARRHPEFMVDGNQATFDGFKLIGPVSWQVDQVTHTLHCRITLRVGDQIAFVLGTEEVLNNYDADAVSALAGTTAFWQRWAGDCSCLGPYHEVVVRSALLLKLLSDVPTGAIIAAPTTSLPEEIGGERNWDYRFTWIRDASFTQYALLLAGFRRVSDPFFHWVVETVKLEGTGIQILYPISPEGRIEEQTLSHLRGYRDSRPVRIGNGAAGQVQLDVYGEVLDALYFATEAGQYDPVPVWDHFLPLIDWAADHWHEPENGIWEVRGGTRHFVYGKVMMWVALDRGIKLARRFHLPGNVAHWKTQRAKIRADVLKKGWSDSLKAFKQSYEDERLDASNLLMPMVGFIDGKDPRMVATVDATLDQLVSNGLCYRYHAAPEGVSGSEATFVLCTFWLIDALILAGRVEHAKQLFDGVLARATPLGLFAEEIDPQTGEHLGNFPQAFSHLGVINAAVSLAHVGHIGSIQQHHAEAGTRAGVGGGGAHSENTHDDATTP
ncbi:MAG: glycoside hydrolase family 15 protein [Herpetosiphon sp.]